MDDASRARLREEIAAEEKALYETKKRLSALRQSLEPEAVTDYELTGPDGPVKLSALFGNQDDLILIHNMGKGCAYCTLWADGFAGLLPHLADRAAFVVVSPDAPEVQQEFAAGRGWTFRMVSDRGSDFTGEMGFLGEDGKHWPGVTAFRREGGEISRAGSTFFGPGDDFCSVWHLFDLLPGGPSGWQPKHTY